jgi:hypothetical protein
VVVSGSATKLLLVFAGSARLGLTIRKVKMDYKGIMEKPFFTLSVRARGGTMLEQSQDTPPGIFSRGVMIADQALVLSTPISELPQGVNCLAQRPTTQ